MAEKLIQITVKATVRDVEDKLKEVIKELKSLDEQAGRTASALGPSLEDVSERARRLQERAAGLGNEARELGQEIEADAQRFGTMSAAMESAAAAAVFLGVGFAGIKLGQKALELARVAAASQALRQSYHDLSASGQVDSQLLLDSLDKAAKGTVSDLNLMKAANAAWYLGISQNVDQYTDLMKIAEEKSKDFGMTTAEYWNRVTGAIASGYPIALQQLGIVIDNERAYESYAATIGKTVDELTEQDEIQARVVAVIASSGSVLRDWEQAEDDATTATQRFDAAAANLSDTLKERLLPYLIPAIEKITELMTGMEDPQAAQLKYINELIALTGSAAAAEAQLTKEIIANSRGRIDQAEAMQLAHIAMLDYRLDLIGIDKGIQEDIRAMRMGSAATMQLADDQGDLGRATEEAAKAADSATDIWHDYLTSVEREQWQFTQRVEQLAFRQAQASEDAAFGLYEIERDAGQRRDDQLTKYWLDEERKLQQHQMKMRWATQDHLDDVSDMEWDHQQDKRQLLDKAPWWIRQALGNEYAERERIAATGDKEALAAYDRMLLERIRAIDPVYARELDLLEERYAHEKDIEEREFGQGQGRQQEQFDQENRAQRAQLEYQLNLITRELGDQLEAQNFHNQQRLENEKRAMDELNAEHAHKLDTMRDDTEYRLSQLPSLYKHAGYTSWLAWLKGFGDAQSDYGFSPATGYDPSTFVNPFAPSAQFGMGYVPRTMLAMVHQGEAILPPDQAQQWRGGGITIGEVHLHGNYTPFLAKKMANEFATELGNMTTQRSR